MLVYVMFSFWIQICRKLYFTNLSNPKNPNRNLDSMDYVCEIRLLLQSNWVVTTAYHDQIQHVCLAGPNVGQEVPICAISLSKGRS